ncbi:hypothetical protein MNBD_PLANCTO02-293 [hydrothermal vent metagenome]|uniref:RNA polymerase sigma-70 ECF-like HTH domain-containing protein n=1 Tax=hydrothermal vent metagenome TaxID=652676 RepID=A0A3B1E5J7_9ZZZZ
MNDACLTLRENNRRRQLLANKRSETTPLPLQPDHKQSKITLPQQFTGHYWAVPDLRDFPFGNICVIFLYFPFFAPCFGFKRALLYGESSLDSKNHQLEQLLNEAHQGDAEALGKLVDHFRSNLQAMSEKTLHGALKRRISDSDVVQQSCLSAVQSFEQFEGDNLPQFAGWLRKIHQRNIQNINRHNLNAQKRDVSREQKNASELVDNLNQTPSQRMIGSEQVEQLEKCLEKIPLGQREAVRLRYLNGLSIQEMTIELDKTESAVAGLLKRGLSRLRELMRELKSE